MHSFHSREPLLGATRRSRRAENSCAERPSPGRGSLAADGRGFVCHGGKLDPAVGLRPQRQQPAGCALPFPVSLSPIEQLADRARQPTALYAGAVGNQYRNAGEIRVAEVPGVKVRRELSTAAAVSMAVRHSRRKLAGKRVESGAQADMGTAFSSLYTVHPGRGLSQSGAARDAAVFARNHPQPLERSPMLGLPVVGVPAQQNGFVLAAPSATLFKMPPSAASTPISRLRLPEILRNKRKRKRRLRPMLQISYKSRDLARAESSFSKSNQLAGGSEKSDLKIRFQVMAD